MTGNLGALIGAFPTPVTGAFESIATQNISTNTASVTFSSIPQTYKSLQIRFMGRYSDTGIAVDNVKVEFNGATTGYATHRLYGDGSTVTSAGNASYPFMSVPNCIPFNGNTSGIYGVGIIDIQDYASTTKNKIMRAISGADKNATGGYINLASGFLDSTTALTSITLSGSGVSWVAGSTFALYGIKGA